MGDERFSPYLNLVDNDQMPPESAVQAPFGIGEVETFGNVDTNLFLDASKAFFIEKGFLFYDQVFNYNQIDESARYFFCEGTAVSKNPLFSNLPFKPTHGETLIIETDDFDFLHTLNKNMYLMHIEGNKYKVGATYNWELTEPVITNEGKADLIERLEAFTSFKYKIIAHLAGIRPTVKDRRPLLEIHELQKNVAIFNGLGAKGVMIAPYFANQLLEHVFNGKEIDREVDIKRFNK
jgi:glycine oxidase